MTTQVRTFRDFLEEAFDQGIYTTDDVISFVMPLFKEVLSFHEAELVAPFEREDALFLTNQKLDIDENFAHKPDLKIDNVLALFKDQHANFDVVGSMKMEADVDGGRIDVRSLNIHLNRDEALKHAAFLPGYGSYELLQGHHDAQTDIFCLGLVLGSMALGLNLYEEKDLKSFVRHRANPSLGNSRIHPTISKLITEMTELDRRKRTQDLYDVIHRLEHYRDYDPEKQTDLSNVAGWVNKELSNKDQIILNKLRNRLFDTSRRNRLLYYKPNMRFVNMTASSVPMVLHLNSIRPDLLFTWNEEISSKVKGISDIILNKYLRFEDHPYLPSSLDKIRVESQRDVQEYGFSQLKLVIAFLNWHNLKEDQKERIQSPLLLIPVELKKNKKLKEDHYVLRVLAHEAEVNPVLANYLRDLYGIKLPDFIDLDDINLDQFFSLVKEQIDSANQGITLNYIDKPKIRIIHSVAKQTISNYRKRLRRGSNSLNSYQNLSYSYQNEDYKPLGLEIFRQHIEQRPTYLEFLINEDIKISSHQLTGEESEKERKLFEVVDNEINPYRWDFDVCNIVLGNFNYKKMSLVRDYNEVIDDKISHTVFEKLFSSEPKQYNETPLNAEKPEDWYHVVTADPTQTKAVLQSRSGESYIIQGPPGTGKSQTITNLIADFVARGKSVLFVCEKRAALDVVYHRLKQQGLDELCCYIHDSQADKREFIRNLKTTYEDFIKNRMDLSGIEAKRKAILNKMSEHVEVVSHFHRTNISSHELSGIEIRKLIERVLELKESIVPMQAKEEELFPHYREWIEFGEVITQLGDMLEETGADPAFAEHPFSKVNDQIFLADNPNTLLEDLINKGQNLLNEVSLILAEAEIPEELTSAFEKIRNMVEDAVILSPLTINNNLHLVDPDHPYSREFDQGIVKYRQQRLKHEEIIKLNEAWKDKLNQQDTETALSIARKYESSLLGFFSGNWRRLKKQLNESYDFSKHQVKPYYKVILEKLKMEYDSDKNLTAIKEKIEGQYQIQELDSACSSIDQLRSRRDERGLEFLMKHQQANDMVRKLVRLNGLLPDLEKQLSGCLNSYAEKDINSLKDSLESILLNSEALADLLPALRSFAAISPRVKEVLRNTSLSPAKAEASMAFRTFNYISREDKKFRETDLNSIERAVQHIKFYYEKLLDLNAEYIRGKIRHKFLTHIDLCNMAMSQIPADKKQFKKRYNDGRKILENEFGKSMRYKSIRELSGKESGIVLKDIKPVWLMSPLSVSDSLPLDVNCFDAIVFDEASQITLEEGIPSLYRAPQTIIVGDDKQMPPSNFFTAKAEDPDDLDALKDFEDEELLSNDTDSLLVQGARKLNSVMLGWHYRSRYETLISFSNHAFYGAELLTIPDRTIHYRQQASILIDKPEEAIGNAGALFDRSISFHYHPNAVYEKRNNQNEALYIAHLVRELLNRNVPESIGIVAFSQGQQHTIENALTQLAVIDKNFERKLEEAYNRTEEEQFIGLFIKNLENVQGDERDIIIMSICYGFDRKRKMIMNFGPINKKGGEKRLNVIFSRAKKHMAIVSSIKYADIKNEYNEGANYFRNFLHYAELISEGNTDTARTILQSLVLNKNTKQSKYRDSIILEQIRLELEKQGYEVAENLGHSAFRCSLGVKARKADDTYTLGILLDDERHYSNENILEQYYQRPAILQGFGWRVITVFAKDWLNQPEKVLQQILNRMNEDPDPIRIENFEMPVDIIPPPIPKKVNPPIYSPQNQSTGIKAFASLAFTRLEFKDGVSNKFWEAATEENKLIVCFGRIGTKGQTQIKTFNSNELADREKHQLIREKVGKGYVEIMN